MLVRSNFSHETYCYELIKYQVNLTSVNFNPLSCKRLRYISFQGNFSVFSSNPVNNFVNHF